MKVRLAAMVAALVLALPGAAYGFGISAVSAAPASTQAGGHSAFSVSLTFSSPADGLQDLTVHLPAGLVGNPQATPPCAESDFTADSCPASAQVGTTTVHVTTLGGLIPLDAPGQVYLLQPHANEPGRLGIVVQPVGGLAGTMHLESPISLRDTGDFGLDSTITDIPQTFNGIPITITGLDLTLNATAGGHDFMTNPTMCAPATTRVDATNYAGSGVASATSTFTPTSCGSVPFSPTVSVVPETTRADSPSGYTIRLDVPATEDPIRQSHVSRAVVTLPLGTAMNPGVGDGLAACSDAAFGLGGDAAPACPAGSQIGTVSFTTPLLGTLSGAVYLGAPSGSQLLRLLVDVAGPGFRVKVPGNVDLDPSTGQVTSTFNGLPQLPFTRFELAFRGGDKAILTTPPGCGDAVTNAVLSPFSGGAAATPSSSFAVTDCANGFSPSVAVSASPDTSGAATALTVTLARNDRDQRLRNASVLMPPGLAGSLAGVPQCALAAAQAGACPADTRVGSVTTTAGPGAAPLTLAGNVYLTGPQDGSLAGLAIVVPARVGPFDFGNVISFARFDVSGADVRLKVTTSDLPTTLAGIPLDLRALTLTLDRPGFARNATSCAPQQLDATFTSQDGSTASSSAPYQATGCATLPFTPRITATVGAPGQTKAASKPPVDVIVSQPAGQADQSQATVILPSTLNADLTALHIACPTAAAAAGACPASSQVGTARADSPLLGVPLTGPVYLVQPPAGGGAILPELQVRLNGPIPLVLRGTVAARNGRLATTFAGLPDVPLSRFELALRAGGILVASKDLCSGTPATADGEFVAFSGATAKASAPATPVGCSRTASSSSKATRPTATATLRGHKLTIRVRGTSLRRISVRFGKRTLRRTSKKSHSVLTLTARVTRRAPTRLTLHVRDANGKTTTLHVKVKRLKK